MIFHNASYQLKYWLRKMVRYSLIYKKAYSLYNVEFSQEQQEKAFWEILNYAIKHVPFYKNYQQYLDSSTIQEIPILYKEDIAKNAPNLVSNEFNLSRLLCVSTGGTTGVSTNIYTSWKDEIRSTAYTDALFNLKRIKKPVICTIREHDLQEKEEYRFWGNRLMFSPSNINKTTLKRHVDLIIKHKVNILHCYPSSLLVFAKLAKEAGICLINIEEIIVSSETCPIEVYEIVKKVFPKALFINFYGQTENVVRGISVNGQPFHFQNYPYFIEFIDTGERQGENIIANIIGTNIEKKSMPLIRFFTGDQAILDQKGNVLEILGRTSEYLIGKKGNPIPCIVTNRPNTLENVLLAQYYQDTEGFFEYRIIVNSKFSEQDIQAIKEDIILNFGEDLAFDIKVVTKMEKTPRGKHKKLIQKLDLSKYL